MDYRVESKHEEFQYLDLIRLILETGEHRPDRYVILIFPEEMYFRLIRTELALEPYPFSLLLPYASLFLDLPQTRHYPLHRSYHFSPQSVSSSEPSLLSCSGSSPDLPPQYLYPKQVSRSGMATGAASILIA